MQMMCLLGNFTQKIYLRILTCIQTDINLLKAHLKTKHYKFYHLHYYIRRQRVVVEDRSVTPE